MKSTSNKAIVYLTLLLQCITFANEYDFDVSEFEKKTFEFSGTLEFRPSLVIPQDKSVSWKLKYFENENQPDVLDNYLLIATPIGKIEKNKLLLSGSADLRIGYNHSEKSWPYSITLLEGYAKYEFNTNWSVLVGKKLYKWGKGYIYNPVSFVGKSKDVNDVDASLEGYYSTAIQYNKSISSNGLKNFSHEAVFLPVYKSINRGYSGGDKHWLFNHSYFLIFNTDIDIYFNISQDLDISFGTAAAYNILTNWEIHGELSYLPQVSQSFIGIDTVLSFIEKKDIVQTVVGTRYLAPFDATFYLEYIFNGGGLNQKEMNRWYSDAHNALTSQNYQYLNRIRKYWFENLDSQFQMNHYVYFKVQYPEPFNLLYFTPSLYTLLNVTDKSFMVGLDINYKRFDNLSFNLKLVGLSGDEMSEFGTKISNLKIEAIIKYFF